jgi:hypothetical protein
MLLGTVFEMEKINNHTENPQGYGQDKSRKHGDLLNMDRIPSVSRLAGRTQEAKERWREELALGALLGCVALGQDLA